MGIREEIERNKVMNVNGVGIISIEKLDKLLSKYEIIPKDKVEVVEIKNCVVCLYRQGYCWCRKYGIELGKDMEWEDKLAECKVSKIIIVKDA